MRQNLNINRETNGTYATDLLTEESIRLIKNHNSKSSPLFLLLSHLSPHAGNEDDPMQAPEEEIKKFNYISDPKRRTLAGNISYPYKSSNTYF